MIARGLLHVHHLLIGEFSIEEHALHIDLMEFQVVCGGNSKDCSN